VAEAATATGTDTQNPFSRGIFPNAPGELTQAIARGTGPVPENHPQILRFVRPRPNETERRHFMELQKRRDTHAYRMGTITLNPQQSDAVRLAHDGQARR